MIDVEKIKLHQVVYVRGRKGAPRSGNVQGVIKEKRDHGEYETVRVLVSHTISPDKKGGKVKGVWQLVAYTPDMLFLDDGEALQQIEERHVSGYSIAVYEDQGDNDGRESGENSSG